VDNNAYIHLFDSVLLMTPSKRRIYVTSFVNNFLVHFVIYLVRPPGDTTRSEA